MQFWGRNVKTLALYRREGEGIDDPETGDVKPMYTRQRSIAVAIYPLARGREQTTQGVVPTETWTAVTRCMDVRTGDRLGDPTGPQYKVTSAIRGDTTMTLELDSIVASEVV